MLLHVVPAVSKQLAELAHMVRQQLWLGSTGDPGVQAARGICPHWLSMSPCINMSSHAGAHAGSALQNPRHGSLRSARHCLHVFQQVTSRHCKTSWTGCRPADPHG